VDNLFPEVALIQTEILLVLFFVEGFAKIGQHPVRGFQMERLAIREHPVHIEDHRLDHPGFPPIRPIKQFIRGKAFPIRVPEPVQSSWDTLLDSRKTCHGYVPLFEHEAPRSQNF
jgi:hypothetical protein